MKKNQNDGDDTSSYDDGPVIEDPRRIHARTLHAYIQELGKTEIKRPFRSVRAGWRHEG